MIGESAALVFPSMESYVLRVYRRQGARIVGLIEHAKNGYRSSFHNAEELWAALARKARARARPAAPRARARGRPGSKTRP